MTALLQLKDVRKAFGSVEVVKGIDLSLQGGEILAIVGENGAGKSTLLNMIGGIVPIGSGEILLDGQIHDAATPARALKQGIGFVHQELNLFPNLSVQDNLFIHDFPRLPGTPLLDRRAMTRRARAALDRVGLAVPPGRLVQELSPGERQLVEIARALAADAKIILFDEPTTSLTTHESGRVLGLMKQLRAQGVAQIFISHTLDDVKAVADRIMVMRDGACVATRRADQTSTEEMISLMVGRTLSALFPPRAPEPLAETELMTCNVSVPGLLDRVSLSVRSGEIVGLFGLMGAGRTELLRTIFGLEASRGGEVRMKNRPVERSPKHAILAGMAFVTESRREDGLLLDASTRENLSLVHLDKFQRLGFIDAGRVAAMAEDMVGEMQVRGHAVADRRVGDLSGGNQQKVVIGKWLLGNPELLLLDEPSRGIDVAARFEIYSRITELAAQGTGVIVASSELEELEGLCHRILVMNRGRVAAEFNAAAYDREAILSAAFGEAH